MKKRTSALLLALVMIFSLMAPMANAAETPVTQEAVYLGLENFNEMNTKTGDESTFVHRFFIDGEVKTFTIGGEDENYPIQNQLMEGYIYNVTSEGTVVTDVELQDKGVITMGTVESVGELGNKPVYEITTAAGGASVTKIAAADLQKSDTVKVTDNAVYKAFVAKEYTAPVAGTPGVATLKNYLTTALQPVGTALYVYGGAWDWQDDVSSNQSMTIGLPQSWIDFFQSKDGTYDFKDADANDTAGLPSYYTSNRGWNQYYYAGVDCSAYTGWVIYNITHTEDNTVVNNEEGFVGSATKQAKNFAANGWGTWNHDTAAVAAAGELKVGDIVSMSGHVWVVLGVCSDGSVVFMHSTPSNSREGEPGGGIQIASLNPNGDDDYNCEAYQLADHYMSKYYPQWYERYAISQKGYDYYLGTKSNSNAGIFHWDLSGDALMTDPDGYATKTPTEILGDLFNDDFVPAVKAEAVYLGVKDFTTLDTDDVAEDDFVHQFAINGNVVNFTVATGEEEDYAIQNKLMEGYIYTITYADGVVIDADLQDKGTIKMGTVAELKDTFGEKPVYEITAAVGGATVTAIEASALQDTDTVKVTANAVYKAFVAEEYTAPVEGNAGVATLRNFLTTALQPVGTALYVYGGAWDWQDDVSSNQSMTIGIPQSWIDFFQSKDGTYDFKDADANGTAGLPSYYTSNRGWNQYYYAGVDCSAYTGWIVYNVTNIDNNTVVNNEEGFVGSATKQAYNLAAKGWGTLNHDTAAVAAAGELKVGDVVSMSGHVWVVLGVCDDGSVVFMHSTPSNSREGEPGGGIQIASLNPAGQDQTDCEAYKLADYYMSKYYPQWYERYAISQKSYGSYLQTYTGTGTAGKYAGVFSWDLSGASVMTDPDGFADMKPAEILAAIFGESEDVVETTEAVYMGLKYFTEYSKDDEATFVHQFAIDGVATDFIVACDDPYEVQNQLMEGYIYDITITNGDVTAVELKDKGVIEMGTVADLKATFGDKPVYEITQAVGGSTVTKIEASALQATDTVKVTENAVYKAFVAEEYTAPVAGTPGLKTLKNFLTTALQPVGTAVYVYGGAWDWQDDVSSNQSMTIGIPQSWVDFFQSQDQSYHYKQKDENGSYALSYYTSNRGWNQYYYAGVDCSAYTGWVIYNVTNTESSADNTNGFVGSATKQAKTFAGYGWGTWNHDTAAVAAAGELKVGDVVSMSGHVWVVLGVCDDGSVVFMHSTPSDSRDGYAGGGIQIASLNPNGQSDTNCEAYALANYYMSKYYPQWYERYAISQKSYSSYLQTYTSGTAGTWGGVFSWDLTGKGLLTDPDGYAKMSPAEILADIFNDTTPLTLTYPEGIAKDEVKIEVYKGFPTSASYSLEQMIAAGQLKEIPANEDGTYTLTGPGTYSYHISGEGYYNILKLFNLTVDDIVSGGKTMELTGGKLGTGDGLYDDGFQPTAKPSQAPDTYKMDSRDAMLCIWPDEILNGAFNIENTTHEAGSYNTPAFQGDDALHQVTTQDELVAFMADRDASCGYMYGYSAGTTPNYGFDIPMAIFTNTAIPEDATLEEAAALVKANGKTTVWYQTQIHPNEPASGEAALVIIDRFINDPETKALLDDINVVIVPRINPDGSYLFSRATYDGFDMNRDHMSLKAAELAQLHTVYRLFMAEVVLDGHEFTFYGAGTDKATGKGYMNNADDVQSTPATSMNNDPAVTAIALDMAGDAFQDATDAGLRIYHYGTTVNNPIGRAYFGLLDCLSFLIETRGIGAGRTNFERRVFSQETVIMSYIEGTAERAEEIKQTVAESRARTIEKGKIYDEDDLLYIYQTTSGKTLTDYTIDRYQYAMDGSVYKVTEDVAQKLNDTAKRTRIRPTAYVIPADAENIEKILYIMDNQGAEYYMINEGSKIALEQYYYVGNYMDGTRARGIEAGLREETTVHFKNGAYVFPMDQVAADIIAMTIEPDVTDSNGYDGTLYQYGVVKYDETTKNFPLYRYTKDNARETLVSNGRDYGSVSDPAIRDEADVEAPAAPEATFVDVPASHWAFNAVEAVAKAGLFNGTSANTFSPDADTTRGQLMTVLARLSGAKAATIEEGVAWAVANGVSDGTNPEAKITREQLVTMLYRYTGSPAVTGDLSAYTDAATVSAWAKDAMTWAVSNGIVKGVTETTLVPGANATRAQVATIVQRYAGL